MKKNRFGLGALAAVAAIAFSLLGAASTASAGEATPPLTYVALDAQGNVIETSVGAPGPISQASIDKGEALQAAAAGALRPSITQPACGTRTDFTKLYNETTYCFANPGIAFPHLYNVWRVDSGNNNVQISWMYQGSEAHYSMSQYQVVTQINWEVVAVDLY
jgi:hypothetical protein